MTYSLTVTLAPTLALTAAATSVAVVQSGSGAVSLTAATGGSFIGSITFSVTGLPAGVTAAWSANPITTASGASTNKETLTLTAAAGAKVANTNIVVTAAGDGLVSNQSVTLQLQQAPGFTLAVLPVSVQVQSLSTATVTVTATPVGGLAVKTSGALSEHVGHSGALGTLLGSVAASGSGTTGTGGASISVTSGLPKGFTATFSAPSVTSGGLIVWTLSLAGCSSAVAGSSTLGLTVQLTAVNTGLVYTASVNVPMAVTLTPPALSISAASAALSTVQGKMGSDAVSVVGNGTYSGPVSLSVSGLPSGVTASWSSNPVTLSAESGSSTLTLTASPAAYVGLVTITITAAGDGVAASKQIAVQVEPAPSLAIGAASPLFVGCAGEDSHGPDLVGRRHNIYRGSKPERERIAERSDGFVEQQSSDAERGERFFDADVDGFVRGNRGNGNHHRDGQRGWVNAEQADRIASGAAAGCAVNNGDKLALDGSTTSGATTVTVTPLGGLSAAMTLKVSGLPSGVTAAFSKTSLAAPGVGAQR